MSETTLAWYWFASTLLGLAFGIRAVRRSIRRMQLAARLPSDDPERGAMIDSARSHLRREGVRIAMQAAAFAVGLGALSGASWVDVLAGLVVVGLQWGATINTVLDDRAEERRARQLSAVRIGTARNLMGASVEAEKAQDEGRQHA